MRTHGTTFCFDNISFYKVSGVKRSIRSFLKMSILSPQSFPFGPNTMLEVLLLLLLLQSFDGVLVRVRVRTPRRILRNPVHKKKVRERNFNFFSLRFTSVFSLVIILQGFSNLRSMNLDALWRSVLLRAVAIERTKTAFLVAECLTDRMAAFPCRLFVTNTASSASRPSIVCKLIIQNRLMSAKGGTRGGGSR